MTTDIDPTIALILDALAESNRVLPVDALRQAVELWPDFAPVALEMLNQIADGAEITDAVGEIAFYAIFLMAQQRDIRAYAPLCAIGMRSEAMEQVLGDSITEYLPHIVVRLYDGDPAPLQNLIACDEADEFVRGSALDAFAWLAATGRIEAEHAVATLRAQFDGDLPRSESHVWVSWQNAVAVLGLEPFTPIVKQVFDQGWIDDSIMSFEHFQEDLRELQNPDRLTEKLEDFESTVQSFDDVASLMATWPYFTDADSFPAEDWSRPTDADTAPIRNPLRNVGRNDPCPCGSGKKYKKCCLP